MKSVNKIILLGIVGRDPEIKFSQSGMQVATFSLATSKKAKDKEQVTQWHNLVAFDKTADLIKQYVHKGSKLYVEGELQYYTYEKDGQKRTLSKIVVNDISFLTPASDNNPVHTQAVPEPASFADDDIPF